MSANGPHLGCSCMLPFVRGGGGVALALGITWSGAADAQDALPVGGAALALPGFSQVGFAERPTSQWSFAADAGYANTEAIGGVGATHHRELGSLSLAFAATDWLSVFGGVEGHLDQHSAGGEHETAAEGLPLVGARVHTATSALRYGAELEFSMPGSNAPSVEPNAITPELRALAGFDGGGTFVVAGSAGFRLDRSGQAAPEPATLSAGDRVALMASEYDAVPIGVAVGARLEPVLVFLEGSAEVLLGGDPKTSPARVTLGARHSFTRNWQLEARASAGLSSRPTDPFGPELLPFEPRFGGAVGLRYYLGGEAAPARPPDVRDDSTSRSDEERARPAPEVAAHLPSRVTGMVRDAEGQPLPDVNVTLHAGGLEQEAVTDPEGRFAFESVPEGDAVLEFETVDYELVEVKVVVPGDGELVSVSPTTMKLAVLGAQIQGLVQTFEGQPVTATIQVSPPGNRYESGPDGKFSIDVAPGRYQVQVSKRGYVSQTHEVVVAEKAVIVINVDLRKSP